VSKSANGLLRVESVSKVFPGVKALDNVYFSVKAGEVHALIGENGAGKSTLIKILMGAYRRDSGCIYIKDHKAEINSPLDAQRYGLCAVYQDVIIAPELTVGENFFIGKMPTNRLGLIDWRKVYSQSKDTLLGLGLDIDPRKKIADLSPCEQTMVTIAKIVREKANLVIFDEPTARLSKKETKRLFDLIRRLKYENLGVIYISHVLEEVFEVCDRVTVLRDGQVVGTLPIDKADEDKLISMMVGRSIGEMYGIKHTETKGVVLEVKGLTREPDFRNVSFSLKRGEVLGVYGLVGSGRTPMMRAIFGADRFDKGEILIDGKPARIRSPSQAMAHGIGLVPEERRLQGLAMPLSVKVNINIASYGDISTLGVIRQGEETERARGLVQDLNIQTPSLENIIEGLSGGNQQKVAIAKWLCKNANILLMDEPTTGVDVGAKVEIYHIVEALISKGKSVILSSSYLPEVIGLSDRILVMADGEIVGEVAAKDADEEILMRMASKVAVNELIQ